MTIIHAYVCVHAWDVFSCCRVLHVASGINLAFVLEVKTPLLIFLDRTCCCEVKPAAKINTEEPLQEHLSYKCQ